MTVVVISGSRSIKELTPDIKHSLDRIIQQQFDVRVGDCYGVDTLVQDYLFSNNYTNVTVWYASWNGNGRPRNNKGFSLVPVKGSYTDRDNAMFHGADYGLAIWDGKSKGTKANIDRVKSKVFMISI